LADSGESLSSVAAQRDGTTGKGTASAVPTEGSTDAALAAEASGASLRRTASALLRAGSRGGRPHTAWGCARLRQPPSQLPNVEHHYGENLRAPRMLLPIRLSKKRKARAASRTGLILIADSNSCLMNPPKPSLPGWHRSGRYRSAIGEGRTVSARTAACRARK
jgi:hypothetical protein